MVVTFPCKICNKAVAKNHQSVQCDHWQLWVHIRCNKINLQTYKFLQKNSFAWYCMKWFEDIIPFSTISDNKLSKTNKSKKNKIFKVLTKKNILTNCDLINKLNNAMDDPESEMLSSKYYEPNEMMALFKNTNKHYSFFHLNISSLPFHFWRILNTYHWTQFELWLSWNIRVLFKTKPKSFDLSPTTRIVGKGVIPPFLDQPPFFKTPLPLCRNPRCCHLS